MAAEPGQTQLVGEPSEPERARAAAQQQLKATRRATRLARVLLNKFDRSINQIANTAHSMRRKFSASSTGSNASTPGSPGAGQRAAAKRIVKRHRASPGGQGAPGSSLLQRLLTLQKLGAPGVAAGSTGGTKLDTMSIDVDDEYEDVSLADTLDSDGSQPASTDVLSVSSGQADSSLLVSARDSFSSGEPAGARPAGLGGLRRLLALARAAEK